jgi:hypothetical protein
MVTGRQPTYLIREDHQTPICLSSQNTSHTLRSMPHSVESEIIILLDPMVIPKEFESSFQNTTLGILIWYTKHDDSSAIVAIRQILPVPDDLQLFNLDLLVEIDSLGNFTSGNRQHHCSTTIVASLASGECHASPIANHLPP